MLQLRQLQTSVFEQPFKQHLGVGAQNVANEQQKAGVEGLVAAPDATWRRHAPWVAQALQHPVRERLVHLLLCSP